MPSNVNQQITDAVTDVFDHWKHVMNSPNSKLDDKRVSLIYKRLGEHSVDVLKKAINGCRKDAWWMNNKRNGIKYIFKDADSIESFSTENENIQTISKDEKIFNANRLAGEKAYAARMERQQEEVGHGIQKRLS